MHEQRNQHGGTAVICLEKVAHGRLHCSNMCCVVMRSFIRSSMLLNIRLQRVCDLKQAVGCHHPKPAQFV